jgi:hypothetical protein
MAEYAGYVGNQVPPTDWGKIGTQLFEQYNEVKKDREEKRQVIEDDFATTFQKIGEYESTTNQTINEYLYKGVDEARNALKTQYDLLKRGAITMSDYKLKKNTLSTDWGNVSKALKNNAGIMEGIQKMNASGEMSAVGRYRSEEYGNLLDIKDGKLFVNPDTLRIYGTRGNPDTGVVDSKNNVYSPAEAINQYSIIDKKVDLNNGVTAFLKRVSDYGISSNLGGGKIKLVENARQNPSYKNALDAQVNAMTVTPFDVASVLADYAGGYQVASDAKKKELMASGVKEDNIISMQRINGVLTPVPTATQKEAAKAYVRDQIEVGVGQKEQMTQGFAPQQPREVKEPTAADKKENIRLKAITTKAETANKIWRARQASNQWPLLRSAAVDRGLDSPQVTFLRQRDSAGNLLPPIIRVTGNEMIVDAGGKRKKGGLVTRDLKSEEDVYTFLSPKQDPLSASADYIEGNENFELGTGAEPATTRTRVPSDGWQ